MRGILLTFLFFFSALSIAQNGAIILTDENLGSSFAKNVLLIEDKDAKLDLDQVVDLPDDQFKSPKNDIANLDFTSSTWWVKFSVTNNSTASYFILETA